MSLCWPSTLHSPNCPLNPGARNSLPQLWSPRHPSFPLKSFSATEEFVQLISRLTKMWYSRKKHETWCQKKSWDHSPTTYCLCDLESSFHPFLNLQSNTYVTGLLRWKIRKSPLFTPISLSLPLTMFSVLLNNIITIHPAAQARSLGDLLYGISRSTSCCSKAKTTFTQVHFFPFHHHFSGLDNHLPPGMQQQSSNQSPTLDPFFTAMTII